MKKIIPNLFNNKVKYNNVYFCCTQKTASQWFKNFFKDKIIEKYSGLSVVDYNDYRAGFIKKDFVELPLIEVSKELYREGKISKNLPSKSIGIPLYLGFPSYKSIPKKGDYKTIFILRDPRDIVVSWYKSTVHSHPSSSNINFHRENLNKLDEKEGLKYTIDFLADLGLFNAQKSWVNSLNDGMVLRYEDFSTNYKNFIHSILEYLEFNIPENEVAELIENHHFSNYSKGREVGSEDESSHYRKGVPGDWGKYFDNELEEYFLKKTGALLEELGYK